MLAYHNDPKIKEEILSQLRTHYEADEIIKGVYWEEGKGCAVGCTLHGNNHEEYEIRFGIPTILAKLEDRIFEGLPNASSKEWPLQFMGTIEPGADLSKVWNRFAIWLLSDAEFGVINFCREEDKEIIPRIIDLYERSLTEEVGRREFRTAAWDAAYAGHSAAERWATRALSAACETAQAIANAAYACADAAHYATSAACFAAFAFDDASRSSHYAAQSEKLLQLLNESRKEEVLDA